MRKTRYNQFINRYFNFNKYSKGYFMNTYSTDENGNFTITNAFSIVRINWNFNNKTLYKRYHELDLKRVDNCYNEKIVMNMIKDFENGGYCNLVELKEFDDKLYYIEDNKEIYRYDKSMVKNILNLITKNNRYGVFMNEKQQAICITGEYGYAYLLPQRVF